MPTWTSRLQPSGRTWPARIELDSRSWPSGLSGNPKRRPRETAASLAAPHHAAMHAWKKGEILRKRRKSPEPGRAPDSMWFVEKSLRIAASRCLRQKTCVAAGDFSQPPDLKSHFARTPLVGVGSGQRRTGIPRRRSLPGHGLAPDQGFCPPSASFTSASTALSSSLSRTFV